MTEYRLTDMSGADVTPGGIPFTDLSEARAAALTEARERQQNIHVCKRAQFGPHVTEVLVIVCTLEGMVYPA